MTQRVITQTHLTAFDAFLRQEEKSEATTAKYVRDARRFCLFAGSREISKELTVAYKQAIMQQGYTVRSVNSMLAGVNRFLSFLGWEDCRVRTLKRQREIFCPEERELSKAEYLRLLDAADRQMNLILQTICATGIRVSELRHFTVEAVHRGEVSVRCKSKTRIILIPGKLKRQLLDYARKLGLVQGGIFVTRSGKPLDRSNIWSRMKKLCEKAAVSPKKVFPHNLRKLFARTFYSMEKDIAKLADILGHSSIETTRIYIMTTGLEHRRRIERLGLVVPLQSGQKNTT